MSRAFKVIWTIELDAENELEAASLAAQIQKNGHLDDLKFEVREIGGSGETCHVDLSGKENTSDSEN